MDGILGFLNYGAIGIALALATLAYRLLSREQEKDVVRDSILKSIRNYLFLAVFLSLLFGVFELVKELYVKDSTDESLEVIWSKYYKDIEGYSKTDKIAYISNQLQKSKTPTDTSRICSDYIKELEKCRALLNSYERGFYQNIIKLNNFLKADPDGWTNLKHDTQNKKEIFQALKLIFKKLGYNYDDLTNREVIIKWEELKSNWTRKDLTHIYQSDVPQIVKRFLDKYHK